MLAARVVGAAAVAVAMTLGGCAVDRRPASPDIVGLEEATAFSSSSWDALLRAHEGNLVRCMRARGFEFWSTASWAYLTLGPHGLFGLTTPQAELEYLRTYGYGIARRVSVLRRETVAVRRPSNETYVASLSPRRRQAYGRALFGHGPTAGCAQPQSDVVLRLGLPDGGELGDAYAAAVAEARDSAGYRSWQASVVACIEDAGVEVPRRDLGRMSQPFLQRLLDLAGSEYEVTADDRLDYELSATEAATVPRTALRKLRTDEMRTAATEARCREQAGSGAQDAVDAASAPLVEKYNNDISLLRTALQQITSE